MPHQSTVEEAVRDIRAGRLVIIRDSLDRENEADFVMAAEKVSAAHVNTATHSHSQTDCHRNPCQLQLPAALTISIGWYQDHHQY